MNELMMSDNELAKAMNDIERRRTAIDTPSGQEKASEKMLGILRLIESSGYKPSSPIEDMAMSWVALMREEIILYGTQVITEAVIDFIRTDIREYKQFPSVGDIITRCHEIGYDPRSEYARRRSEAEVERMKAERAAEVQALMTPEYRAELKRKYGHLWGGCGD